MSPSTYKSLGDRQGGDPNIMRIKESNKIRPLDNMVAGWRQHGIEHPSDQEQFASVVCPGARSCPLCRKPVNQDGKAHFPMSRRFAANVWDYDTGSIKVLVAGPAVFDEFKTAATVGIEPLSCDWTITKTGSGLSTKYDVIRHDSAAFTASAVTPDMLHSIDKYEQPASTEKIFEILEKFGIDYDALTIPSYSLEEALAFTMPYTKHKGLTIEQLLAHEQSYAEWMHTTKLEQGQLGDPVFLALQTVMEDRGLVPPLDDAINMLPDPEPEQVQQQIVNQDQQAPTSPAPAADLSPASESLVPLVGPDGQEVMVPPSAVDAMLLSGFSKPEPKPAAASGPVKVLIGGQEVELDSTVAEGLIAAGTAQPLPAVTPEPEPPKLPLPDEVVQVNIAGASVPMPYVQAATVVDNPASNANFEDSDVATAHERVKNAAQSTPDPSPTAKSGNGSTAAAVSPSSGETTGSAQPVDPDKPFVCDQCGAAYKTQGARTQHVKREHKAAEPQPSAVPVTSNGNQTVTDRVKDKIAHATFARDYTRMMAIFDEETGEKNFVNMSEEQLLKLEKRIDVEIAAEATVS